MAEGVRGRLRAVSAAAGRAGVRAGMTVAEARAICAALEVRPWDDAAIARAITETTAALILASPQVTPVAGAPGMWWVGAGGFDGLGGERTLVRTLGRIARAWHPAPRIGVADSCVAARAATWHVTRPGARGSRAEDLSFVVPPGGCAAYLAPAPLGLIPMEDELREALHALGLRTIGALAALSADDVERRWGVPGLSAWRLARGEDRRRPVLARVEARRAVAAELGTPSDTMEPVLFLVRAALDRLVAELAGLGRAAAAVAITLTLDVPTSALPTGARAHTVTREVRPARPLARVAPLFEQCRALLEGWPLAGPVCAVEVAIPASAPAPAEQGDLLAPSWRDAAALDAAIARLRAELGPGVVVRPVARDEHRLERAGAWVEAEPEDVPVPAGAGTADAGAPGGLRRAGHDGPHAERALRLLETPEPVEVECVPGAPGAMPVPHTVRWRGRRIAVDRPVGPEHLSGDWWRDGYHRDYWRCESGETGDFVLYLDREAAGWYLHGWYD